MSFEERVKKFENSDALENKVEKELSLSEIDELLKKSEKVSDNLDKFSKDEIYKKIDFEDLRVVIDNPNNKFDEAIYAEAEFWKKFDNFFRKFDYFTSFSLSKERYELSKSEDRERFGVLKSKDRGLLDKTKINEDVVHKVIEIGQNNKQEKEYLEKNVIDIQGDFKRDNFERSTAKSFELVDGKIMKYVASGRTEKGQIEAAGKMREAEISRLETVNGAELVGLKETMRKNSENKKNLSEIEGLLSPDGKEKISVKLNEEENQIKEQIREKEEKLAEETEKFREPLEGRLKETMKMEIDLSKVFNFLKEEDTGLKKKIKEYEDGIKKTLKNFSGEVGADIVKDLEKMKAEYEAHSKELEERKTVISSRLDVLKNNRKEIEATLSRVNNIGRTKKEIEQGEKETNKEGKDKKTEIKSTEEQKDEEREEKTRDETRDEVWGLNDEQKATSSNKVKDRDIDIGELFEHYDDSGFEETRKVDDKKDEANKKVKTKKSKKAIAKDKPKDAKRTEAFKKQAKTEKAESTVTTQFETQEESGVMETDQAENAFTDEEIEKIVMKELKTVGFMNNKKVAEKSKDGLTKHLIGAVKNEILKSPEKVTEKFIKNEVDDWYKRLTKNLNESSK